MTGTDEGVCLLAGQWNSLFLRLLYNMPAEYRLPFAIKVPPLLLYLWPSRCLGPSSHPRLSSGRRNYLHCTGLIIICGQNSLALYLRFTADDFYRLPHSGVRDYCRVRRLLSQPTSRSARRRLLF